MLIQQCVIPNDTDVTDIDDPLEKKDTTKKKFSHLIDLPLIKMRILKLQFYTCKLFMKCIRFC